MEMLGPLLLLTLLSVTLGQTLIDSSCLTVNGETVCYDLYDSGSGNEVAYSNDLCRTNNPEGSLATVENVEISNHVKSLATLMDNSGGSVHMWIAGEKHPYDIYFRTKTGRILPINDWEDGEYADLDEHYCASVGDDTKWDTQDCSAGGDTVRYYLCQNKTDTCPIKDVCDRETAYKRDLKEWCFWPYDLRFSDEKYLYVYEGAFFHCRELGGYVMSVHNQDELAKFEEVIRSHFVQSAYDVYDEYIPLHLTMVGYNYRWRNGWAAVGLKELGFPSHDYVYTDRYDSFEEILFMDMTGNPLVTNGLDFDYDDSSNLICEAKRVDLCLFHAYKAPNAVISSNLTHLLYECENGRQFEDGTNTKIFDCTCDFDAVANITEDLICIPTPYCESQLQELGAVCECPPGETWDESGLECEDVDECDLSNGGCDQICENNDGSFKCVCFAGFKTHPNVTTSCMDVDECHDTDHGCPVDSFCVNTPGSFDCVCQRGFELNDATLMCDDVNECEETSDVCGDNSCCINRYGSYFCECESGYHLTDNDRCEDVDECSFEHPPCSHTCDNKDGGFDCSCPPGYELDNSGTTCIDIDECSQNPGSCSGDEECSNVVGSYICHCGEGKLRRPNGACVYPYSTSDMVFDFRLNGPFHDDYENKNSEKFKSIFFAIEQQFFLTGKELVRESSFQLVLRPGSVVAEVTVGFPFTPDLDLTKDVILAVWRAMKANNLLLYLEGQTLPLTEQLSYRTPLIAGTSDFTDICSVYNSLDYCLNGGECQTLRQDQPSCRCEPGFSGSRCDEEAKTKPSVWNWLTIMLLVLVIVCLLLTLLLICYPFLTRGGGNPPRMTAPQTPRRYAPWKPYRPPVGAPYGFPPTRMPMPMRALPGRFHKMFK